MATDEDLAPLFTDVPMTTDDANAIVAALRDIAESDGVHEEELQMISGFVEMLHADFGAEQKVDKMTPEQLARTLVDPTLRTVAVQCAVLLGMADGKLTEKERARIGDYATALGVTGKDYEKIETSIVGWVKSGNAAAMM